jgi:hypothetical protein
MDVLAMVIFQEVTPHAPAIPDKKRGRERRRSISAFWTWSMN